MENFDIIKDFFTSMRCSQCHNLFEEKAINILRQENNYTVVRITCSVCGKNIGLAILGMDKDTARSRLECAENSENTPIETTGNPITFDDVIDAHEFFTNLGSDWKKYIPDSQERE